MPALDLYERSLELLRAHQAPNGAFVASPTFPTYHYCWFRDGAYIAYALDLAGDHTASARFYEWAARAVLRRELSVERAIAAAHHGRPNAADLLDTRYRLDGREGAEEWPNFQLDGFGTLLWAMARHHRLAGSEPGEEARAAADLLARYVGALWRLPCYDCWEEFSEQVHTATLAALYGGLRAAAELLQIAEYAAVAEEIRAFVLAQCVHDGRLCKFVGNPAVDASLLHVATPYRLLEPQHPLMRATAARVEAELRREGGGVHRYADDSYYGGGEWVLLTAYLGWHYAEVGDLERASALCGWIEGVADDQGWLPEQVAEHLNHPALLPVWNERWGASARPLLWSHAAYLTLRAALERA